MGTVKGGRIICNKCNEDCTNLYGFSMSVDRVAHTQNEKIKEIITKIDKKYGKHDFIICWDCTIAMMGIETLASKQAALMRLAKIKKREVINSAPQVVSEPEEIEEVESGKEE